MIFFIFSVCHERERSSSIAGRRNVELKKIDIEGKEESEANPIRQGAEVRNLILYFNRQTVMVTD